MSRYLTPGYPLYMNLTDRPVLVLGGGAVAEQKVGTLLDYGAVVTLISPEVTSGLWHLADERHITWVERVYQHGDLSGQTLAICATGVDSVNRAVRAEADAICCPLNIVDVPHLCDFIVPAIVRRGPLQITVSTSGASPLVARSIKESLATTYDERWGVYVTLLGEARTRIMERADSYGVEEDRRALFSHLASGDLADRVLSGESLSVDDVFSQYVRPFLAGYQRGSDSL